MVEVFATNINSICRAEQLQENMQVFFPGIRINFDIDDCDHILRIEGLAFCVQEILQWLKAQGVAASVLQ
jgi:hypothetical protein